MIHHPLILLPKLIALAVIVVVLVILHGFLAPGEFRAAVYIGAGVFAAFCVGLWVLAVRVARNPDSRLARGLFLSHAGKPTDEVSSADDLAVRVGACGTAASALRPAGVAVIDGKRVSVQTRGEFVLPGSEVRVVEVKGTRVLVAPTEDGSP